MNFIWNQHWNWWNWYLENCHLHLLCGVMLCLQYCCGLERKGGTLSLWRVRVGGEIRPWQQSSWDVHNIFTNNCPNTQMNISLIYLSYLAQLTLVINRILNSFSREAINIISNLFHVLRVLSNFLFIYLQAFLAKHSYFLWYLFKQQNTSAPFQPQNQIIFC